LLVELDACVRCRRWISLLEWGWSLRVRSSLRADDGVIACVGRFAARWSSLIAFVSSLVHRSLLESVLTRKDKRTGRIRKE